MSSSYPTGLTAPVPSRALLCRPCKGQAGPGHCRRRAWSPIWSLVAYLEPCPLPRACAYLEKVLAPDRPQRTKSLDRRRPRCVVSGSAPEPLRSVAPDRSEYPVPAVGPGRVGCADLRLNGIDALHSRPRGQRCARSGGSGSRSRDVPESHDARASGDSGCALSVSVAC
jgi:hypothetical protein